MQHLLRDEGKNKERRDLFDQIGEVIPTLPSHLADAIDAVRNIGNFAAHPMKSTNTGEIVDVEPGEAEWNLEVLEGLFDFYFVQPALLQKKKAALNAKLAAAKQATNEINPMTYQYKREPLSIEEADRLFAVADTVQEKLCVMDCSKLV